MIRALIALVVLLAIALECSLWKGTHPTIAILTIFGLGVALFAVICFAAYLSDCNADLKRQLDACRERLAERRTKSQAEIDKTVDGIVRLLGAKS